MTATDKTAAAALEFPPELRFYSVPDLQRMFHVGRSKARLMMDALPSVRAGNKDCVSAKQLADYIAEHDGIPVKWPKRRR